MTYEWEVSSLDNGLRVVTTSDPRAQSVSLTLVVRVGSRAEERRTNGLTHYIEHMLFKGTTKRPDAIEISAAIEGAGGSLNAYTTKEVTAYWNHLPFDKMALGMDVLADMLTNSLLDQGEIDRERTVVQAEIRRSYDQPGAWAGELLSTATYGDQPIGWPIAGTVESVGVLQRPDFVVHLTQWYRPANMVLSVGGNTTHDEVMTLAASLFGDIEPRETPTPLPARPLPRERSVVAEQRPIQQCHLGLAMLGIARRDPDRHPLSILNTILGRGMSSRLFREVRERRGLAYSVGSGVSRYQDTGTVSVSAGVAPEKLEEATRVIVDELLRFTAEPVSEDELRRAKDFAIGSFRLGLETSRAIARRAGEELLQTGEVEPIEQVVAGLEAVTPVEIERVAERLFQPERFVIAVVGPQADEEALARIISA